MGTIAARDCLRILELTEQVAVAALLAVVQAIELRGTVETLSPTLQQTVKQLRQHSQFLDHDRVLEHELRQCVQLVRDRWWQYMINNRYRELVNVFFALEQQHFVILSLGRAIHSR